jgi:hypothetical protein
LDFSILQIYNGSMHKLKLTLLNNICASILSTHHYHSAAQHNISFPSHLPPAHPAVSVHFVNRLTATPANVPPCCTRFRIAIVFLPWLNRFLLFHQGKGIIHDIYVAVKDNPFPRQSIAKEVF